MSARLLGRRLWLSVAEFADLSGLRPETVRKRCLRGTIRCRKTGDRWRIAADELKHLEGVKK